MILDYLIKLNVKKKTCFVFAIFKVDNDAL